MLHSLHSSIQLLQVTKVLYLRSLSKFLVSIVMCFLYFFSWWGSWVWEIYFNRYWIFGGYWNGNKIVRRLIECSIFHRNFRNCTCFITTTIKDFIIDCTLVERLDMHLTQWAMRGKLVCLLGLLQNIYLIFAKVPLDKNQVLEVALTILLQQDKCTSSWNFNTNFFII